MLRAGGRAGSIENLIFLNSANEHRFYIRDHVDSRWVADENGDLMGAFSPVESRTIMENAYVGTNPKIQSIGGGRYLLAFLDDDPDRDRLQAGKLMWTVYDANDNTFTEPRTVQDDVTLDTAPFLADAGDKVVLTWSSIDPEKYEALIDEVRGELAEKIGAEFDDDIVQIELEEDPSRLSNLLDIYCVQFDKDSESFGSIEQLTDDEFEDSDAKVVYDEETKDYIVLYTKTSQESKEYASLDEKLIDNFNPHANPDKTYSVMCYMLYNGTQEEGDKAPVGWVRDHLYDYESKAFGGNEASIAAFLENYGGQRFLATSFNGLTDPPIPWSAAAFGDVASGTWYSDAVAWAAENGIVTGYDADTFGPNDIVTREQIVTILYRYAKFRGLNTDLYDSLAAYTDADTVSGWARDAFRWAVAAGVIKGISQTLLSPKTEATRAQVATMLMRFSRLGTASTALIRQDNGARIAVY